ncbi:MAG: 2,3-bisphosphoglycerate-independent phosphoglycerate mutase [Candidatus Omnitrophica bacterium]|nr:2,3-bisphosphoglycerate-independent phosphoglycerate mutase [Candidatus Omnitrophota bacterium]
MKKKLLYIVLDGLGDLPIKELGDKTPLEAAAIPNMDKLAKTAKMGVVHTVGKGIAPESDVAVISILGYDAHKSYTGRGPLESFAENLDIEDGDLAYRVNFATKDPNSDRIIDRRVGRNLSTEEATALAKEINEKVKLESVPASFVFKNTIGHRGILLIKKKGGRLSAEVTNTDPAYDREGVFGVAKERFEPIALKCKPTEGHEDSQEAREAAALTNEFVEKSHKVLQASVVNNKRAAEGKQIGNLILARDGGDGLPKFEPMSKKYSMKFGCFVEMPVEKGIALLTGMEIVSIPLPTGVAEKDYPLRADKVIEAMKAYDALYIHLKGPDEPAHDGDYQKKRRSIEEIDKYFFGNLLDKVDLDNTLIAVTADHSTPCKMKAHSGDPVPLFVAGCGIASDGLDSFGESNAKKGSLGELMGLELMGLFVKLMK